MPDIAMCRGEGCLLRDYCYRYRAVPSEYRQSYFSRIPFNGKTCEYFLEIEGGSMLSTKEQK